MEITNFPGRTHTREDTPRATPNRLEASFKSNKRESTFGDDSSALEMGMAALKVRCSSSHSNLALTQALAQILTKFSSWKDWGEVLKALECVVFVEAAANE